MTTIRLKYKGPICLDIPSSPKQWDVLSPRLPGYDYSHGGYPTLSLEGLLEHSLITRCDLFNNRP